MSFWSYAKEMFDGQRPLASMFSPRTIRVAVIGGKASGKTVFMTALANHLMYHNPSLFPLDGLHVWWDKIAIKGNTYNGMTLFDYNSAKSCLTKGEWPSKTAEPRLLVLPLLLKDRKGDQEDVMLEILDIPGERVADFPMMGKDYREWCEWLQESLAGPNGSSIEYREYLNAIDKYTSEDEAKIFKAYRDYIDVACANFQGVSPSTIKLELDGTLHLRRAGNFRQEIESVPLGIKDEKGNIYEFAPLPASAFSKESSLFALVSKFEKAYKMYVKKVIRPMEGWLGKAQKLFYLVDVLSLLQAGSATWDTEKEYAEAAISALCPHRLGAFGRIARWAKGFFWRTQISKVYVVATKSDLVFSTINRDNMNSLAGELLGKALALIDKRVETKIVSCAAVCSTREVLINGERCLKGVLDDVGDASWIPSDVPPKKPDSSTDWNAMIENGMFNYQFARPGFDASQSCPPPHLGLNTLVREMLEL